MLASFKGLVSVAVALRAGSERVVGFRDSDVLLNMVVWSIL